MSLRSTALGLVAISAVAAVMSAAGPKGNLFTFVNDKGRTIGKASFEITPSKDGFKVSSHFDYRTTLSPEELQAAQANAGGGGRRGGGGPVSSIVEGQYNAEYKYSADGNFLNGYTQDTASQVLTSFQPSKTRDLLITSQTQAGNVGNANQFQIPRPDFIVAPRFDPSVIQVLLTTGLTHPHADGTYLLMVPTQRDVAPAYVIIQPVPGSIAATLNGQPIKTLRYLINFHTDRIDTYIDESGQLLQANVNSLHVSYIRQGFNLPAK
jgi:hypothetical protein